MCPFMEEIACVESLFVHSAIVPSSNVRPVETSIQALGVKRTSGFMRACSELARHRELLARPAANSDDSSDEHNHLDVAVSRRKVNSWLMFQFVVTSCEIHNESTPCWL